MDTMFKRITSAVRAESDQIVENADPETTWKGWSNDLYESAVKDALISITVSLEMIRDYNMAFDIERIERDAIRFALRYLAWQRQWHKAYKVS